MQQKASPNYAAIFLRKSSFQKQQEEPILKPSSKGHCTTKSSKTPQGESKRWSNFERFSFCAV